MAFAGKVMSRYSIRGAVFLASLYFRVIRKLASMLSCDVVTVNLKGGQCAVWNDPAASYRSITERPRVSP